MPRKRWSFEEVQDYASKNPNLRPKEVDGGWIAEKTPHEFQYEIPETDVPETKYNLPETQQSRMGLDFDFEPAEYKYKDPTHSASGREFSNYRKNKINKNNLRKELFAKRERNMKRRTQARVDRNRGGGNLVQRIMSKLRGI